MHFIFGIVRKIFSKINITLKQEQQRVAVGPGNAHFSSIRQVSSYAATLRRCSRGPPLAAAVAADAAEYSQFAD